VVAIFFINNQHRTVHGSDQQSYYGVGYENRPIILHGCCRHPSEGKQTSEELKKINIDPWDEFKKYSDPDDCEFLHHEPNVLVFLLTLLWNHLNEMGSQVVSLLLEVSISHLGVLFEHLTLAESWKQM
jgi:hypothetical protein